jgi:hypothetical protein
VNPFISPPVTVINRLLDAEPEIGFAPVITVSFVNSQGSIIPFASLSDNARAAKSIVVSPPLKPPYSLPVVIATADFV